jgi:hypothetical protein
MKLVSIATHVLNVSARTNWTFVRVRFDDGSEGIGEASLERWESLVVAYAADLGRVLEARCQRAAGTPRDVSAFAGRPRAHAVRSATEQACCVRWPALPACPCGSGSAANGAIACPYTPTSIGPPSTVRRTAAAARRQRRSRRASAASRSRRSTACCPTRSTARKREWPSTSA